MNKRSYPSCLGVDHVSHCWIVGKKGGGKSTFFVKYGGIRRKTGTQIKHKVEIWKTSYK
jgi:ABC-type lipoprotein export system ATPase subunit